MVGVPVALPGGVVLASNNVTISIVPATTYAAPGTSFTFDTVINNPDGMDVFIHEVHFDFDPTYFTVNSVSHVDFSYNVVPPAIDNVNGTVDWGPSMPLGSTTNATSIISARVNCTATMASGVSDVSWVYTTGPPPRLTKVEDGVEYLGGDFNLMNNGTVIIGSPTLVVNVNPPAKGSVDVDPPSGWDWNDIVDLEAIDSTAGWTFSSWTGDVANPSAAVTTVTIDTVTMNMTTLTKTVTANFVELPCDLDVDPNTIPQLKARYAATGGNEDSDTVTISNLGGGTLCWAVGTPPTLAIGDNWAWINSYGGNSSTLTVNVTDDTDPDVYETSVNWAPSLDVLVNTSTMGVVPVRLVSATQQIDKCTHDVVKQDANLQVFVGTWYPANATLTWTYYGCHGWPYYMYKSWAYVATEHLCVGGDCSAPVVVHPMVYAVVTNFTDTSPVLGPLGGYYWEITHCLNASSPAMIAATTFKQAYWDDTAKTFVAQWDAGTYLPPPPPGSVDIRAPMTACNLAPSTAPACCDAPSWLSFDKVGGSLGISGNEVLTVTANTTGLAVGTYNGSFCISSCCGSVDYECVNVSLWVQPATTLTDLVRDLPPDALDYDAEYPGDSFFVYVNFTSLGDDFNSIGVTDYAPAGWLVETNNAWCNPPASYNKSNYNKAEYAWAGSYNSTQTFSAKYQVTIPATANPGSNFWPECSAMPCPPCGGSPINNYPAWVDYWIAADGPFETMICDEREKVVTVPGCVTGETRDVLGNVLDTVTVNLYEDDDVWEDQDSSSIVGSEAVYEVCADDTGMYYLVASKYCYFTLNTRPTGDGGSMPGSRNPAYPDYIDFSTPELLAAGNVTDFVGDYGLVCKAASLSMAMEAVNHMLFIPEEPLTVQHPDWQLSGWKVTQVVNSWQFPCGCNC
jgi:hypothetical protein